MEFWRCSVLLAKIVDGRLSLWAHPTDGASDIFLRFLPTVEAHIDRRIRKWKDKRKNKLFGGDVPDDQYLR